MPFTDKSVLICSAGSASVPRRRLPDTAIRAISAMTAERVRMTPSGPSVPVMSSVAATSEAEGHVWSRPSMPVWICGPSASTIRAASLLAAATLTCWPSTARQHVSKGSKHPGKRVPRTFAPERIASSAMRPVNTASGSQSRSNIVRTRASTIDAAGKSDSLIESTRALWAGSSSTRIQPEATPPSGIAMRAARAYDASSTTSTPASARPRKNASSSLKRRGGR